MNTAISAGTRVVVNMEGRKYDCSHSLDSSDIVRGVNRVLSDTEGASALKSWLAPPTRAIVQNCECTRCSCFLLDT